MTMGAPPGTITNGSRGPNFHGPNDCTSEPRPQTRNVAAIRFTVSAEPRFSAFATRKTEVIGTAAITSTCCRPKASSCGSGSRASTGAIDGAVVAAAAVVGEAVVTGAPQRMKTLGSITDQIDLGGGFKTGPPASIL